MDISKISSAATNNTIDAAKSKAVGDDFEKRLQSAVGKNDEKELKKACNDFEGIILSLMYKQMRATVPKSELIPSDSGSDIFQSMLDDKLVEEASKSGGMGLGGILYKQLSQQLKPSSQAIDEGGSPKTDANK